MSAELQIHQPGYNQVGVFQEAEALFKFREAMQGFTDRLNRPPQQEAVDKTPDGKAGTILISHIEMLLDEYFFGLWSTENFRWQQIGNEVVGAISLIVVHPVWGKDIKREGAGAITIMVDRAPDGITPTEKNLWALDMANKKSNALDMGFPKLKAECMKNAANSFGKHFGRDLNRKKQDNYNPLQPKAPNVDDLRELFELKKEAMTPDDIKNAERIIDNNEKTSFTKLYKQLSAL